MIVGNSPFQGMKLLIFQSNQHLYPCLSDEGLEVWSFGQNISTEFPIVTSKEIFEKYAGASGNYIDPTIGGPPPRQIRGDPDNGITLSFPGDSAPAKCLITAWSANEVSFVSCLGGGPQDYSYKLIKNMSNWDLVILHAETDDPIIHLPQTRV